MILSAITVSQFLAWGALTWCTLVNKPADDRGRRTYACSSGSEKFTALCDIPVDEVEFSLHRKDYMSAKWIKAGNDEGIDFKKGFIACEKVKNPKTAGFGPVKSKKGIK